MKSALKGEGGTQKRRQKERMLRKSVFDKGEGDRGSKKSEHFSDVIYGSPQRTFSFSIKDG